MSYSTLMVHLDLERPNEALLRVAGDLATRFKAGLIGTAAADTAPQLYFAEGPASAEAIEIKSSSIIQVMVAYARLRMRT